MIEEEGEVAKIINGEKWPLCLGPKSFMERIKAKYGAEKIDKDIPSSRELLPDTSQIVKVVCEYYEMAVSDMLKMRRGRENEARNVAIYLTRKLRRDILRKIGFHFEIDNDSTAGSVIGRMRKKLAEDRKLRIRLGKLEALIIKSQERTWPFFMGINTNE